MFHVFFYKLLIGFLVCIPFIAQAMDKQTLSINKQLFHLEVPETAKEYNHGLMYRHHLPEGYGMLFVFDPKTEVVMWMKNTYIALDMLFIGADNRIVCIFEHTTPLSLKMLSCDAPVMAVIELNAGDVKKFHLLKGMILKKSTN
jgi:hypothetical protein